MTWLNTLVRECSKAESGEARYWVNDSGPKISLDIDYPGDPDGHVNETTLVGLVDEQIGGMIAYGSLDIMEQLADRLNTLHVIEQMSKSLAAPS